jgi:cyclopropane-fatty-acyl-phospholipid synthase
MTTRHYALTLRAWVQNLEGSWAPTRCSRPARGEARARIWRLYMAASALTFEAGRT